MVYSVFVVNRHYQGILLLSECFFLLQYAGTVYVISLTLHLHPLDKCSLPCISFHKTDKYSTEVYTHFWYGAADIKCI